MDEKTSDNWLNGKGRNPHQRLDTFSELWAAHMAAWKDHGEWRAGLDTKLARVLNGLLPTTESADDIVLEMVELEKQQQAFSPAINGAETKVIDYGFEMQRAKDIMDTVEARCVLVGKGSNPEKRKAELLLALSKDTEWKAARAAYRNAERNKLIAEAHLKELERDRSRIAGQVWSRRSRLDLLAARLNAVMKKGETK